MEGSPLFVLGVLGVILCIGWSFVGHHPNYHLHVTETGAAPVTNAFWGSPWKSFPGSFRWTPAFPDKASQYNALMIKVETGHFDAIQIQGQFPQSRYFGINLYDYEEATDFRGLADHEIVPDEGSHNPFIIGADRNTAKGNRNYTILLVKEGTTIPENTTNVLTYPDGIHVLAFMTRVYRPDQGKDLLGGVPLPAVNAIKWDKTPARAPKIGTILENVRSKLHMFLFNRDLITTWQVMKEFSGVANGSDRVDFYRTSDTGLFPNAHVEYIVAALDQSYWNKVAVITLPRVPSAEDTYRGGPLEGDTNVRYWSFCVGDLSTTGTPDCLCDDQVQKNPDGSVTLVVAPSRLKTSILLKGWNHLNWGTLVYKPLLIHRQMLASENFVGRIGNVEPIGRPPASQDRNQKYMDDHRAERWMGDYSPRGKVTGVQEFEEEINKD